MVEAGTTAIVTGAGRGIGRRIAQRLAADGAQVMLAARGVEQLKETAEAIAADGGTAAVCPTDVTDEAAVQDLVAATLEAFGRLDTLVCNSGIGGPSGPLWELDRQAWDETLSVNVTGTFLCCKAAVPQLIGGPQASIVVIGSMTGKRPLLQRTPYAASKLALVGMVRTLAHELGPHGVRANLVSPGPVEGERIEWVIERQAEAKGIPPAEARAELEAQTALGALVDPGDIADAVAFLAGPDAARITGEDLNVSAGMVMH